MNSVTEHYDQFLAAHYSRMAGGHDQQIKRNREFFQIIGLSPAIGQRVLDLGCGSGFQTLALAEMGFEVVAVDTSQTLLHELQNRANEKPIAIIHGDMLDSELYCTHGPFDAAVCMGDTLTHIQSVDDVAKMFSDVHDSLNSGGRLILSFRDLSHELRGIERAIPVRLEEHELMATFLEYEDRHVIVNDMLFSRNGGQWKMSASAYRKLRLAVGVVCDLLEKTGFSIENVATDRGFATVMGQKAEV